MGTGPPARLATAGATRLRLAHPGLVATATSPCTCWSPPTRPSSPRP